MTSAAGLVLIAELDRVLGIADAVDEAVGAIKGRRQGHGAGGVILALAESIPVSHTVPVHDQFVFAKS